MTKVSCDFTLIKVAQPCAMQLYMLNVEFYPVAYRMGWLILCANLANVDAQPSGLTPAYKLKVMLLDAINQKSLRKAGHPP